MAQSAQAFEMAITYASGVQARGERIGVELRIVAGFRDGADVDDASNAVGAKQRDEFTDGMGGVADGEDC